MRYWRGGGSDCSAADFNTDIYPNCNPNHDSDINTNIYPNCNPNQDSNIDTHANAQRNTPNKHQPLDLWGCTKQRLG